MGSKGWGLPSVKWVLFMVGLHKGICKDLVSWFPCIIHNWVTLPVTAWLACMPENYEGMCRNPMMGSGGLPEGGLESVSPRMEAGEPLEGRSVSNNEVSMSHGHSRQDSDYLAHWPILAWSMQCERRASTQEAAQWSLDASVSLMIVHD